MQFQHLHQCRRRSTAGQEASTTRLVKASAAYGTPEGWSPREAFEATIKSSDMYSLEQTTIRPYCPEKLKVMTGGVTPLPLRPRLPPDAVEKLDQLWTPIVRPQSGVEVFLEAGEISGITPYWDVVFRGDCELRVVLFRELAAAGLMAFTTINFCCAALFFVDKKGTQIRMIVDGRAASQYCHRPPYAPLGSAGAWAQMDLCSDLARNGIPPSAPLFGVEADFSDGFHQFTDPELGGLFGVDFPELASVYGTDKVYCLQRPVHSR